jgi:hypothetical protein
MMSTAYCAACVQVTPFIPPKIAKKATTATPISTPCAMSMAKNRLNTIPTPRICPAT